MTATAVETGTVLAVTDCLVRWDLDDLDAALAVLPGRPLALEETASLLEASLEHHGVRGIWLAGWPEHVARELDTDPRIAVPAIHWLTCWLNGERWLPVADRTEHLFFGQHLIAAIWRNVPRDEWAGFSLSRMDAAHAA